MVMRGSHRHKEVLPDGFALIPCGVALSRRVFSLGANWKGNKWAARQRRPYRLLTTFSRHSRFQAAGGGGKVKDWIREYSEPAGARTLCIKSTRSTDQGPKSDWRHWASAAASCRRPLTVNFLTRPMVKCGWKGRSSGMKPSGARASSNARFNLSKAAPVPARPAQMMRGRAGLGKHPRPRACRRWRSPR